MITVCMERRDGTRRTEPGVELGHMDRRLVQRRGCWMRWDVNPAEIRDAYIVTKGRDLLEKVVLGKIASFACSKIVSFNIPTEKVAELYQLLSPTFIDVASTNLHRHQTSSSKGFGEEIFGILPWTICEGGPPSDQI
jgi:hypothetical protein